MAPIPYDTRLGPGIRPRGARPDYNKLKPMKITSWIAIIAVIVRILQRLVEALHLLNDNDNS